MFIPSSEIVSRMECRYDGSSMPCLGGQTWTEVHCMDHTKQEQAGVGAQYKVPSFSPSSSFLAFPATQR